MHNVHNSILTFVHIGSPRINIKAHNPTVNSFLCFNKVWGQLSTRPVTMASTLQNSESIPSTFLREHKKPLQSVSSSSIAKQVGTSWMLLPLTSNPLVYFFENICMYMFQEHTLSSFQIKKVLIQIRYKIYSSGKNHNKHLLIVSKVKINIL